MNVTVRNVITSMRLISAFDWAEFFESVSLVDEALAEHPGYRAMDFATRDLYRHAVEDLARGAAAARSKSPGWRCGGRSPARRPRASRPEHRGAGADPGYYLIAEGRRAFERELGYRAPPRPPAAPRLPGPGDARLPGDDRPRHRPPPGPAAAAPGALGAPAATLLALGLLALVPASDLALPLINSSVMKRLRPTAAAAARAARRRARRAAHPGRRADPADHPGGDRGADRPPRGPLPRQPGGRAPLRPALRLARRARAERCPATKTLLAAAAAGIARAQRPPRARRRRRSALPAPPPPPGLERGRTAAGWAGSASAASWRSSTACCAAPPTPRSWRSWRSSGLQAAGAMRGPLRHHPRRRHPAAPRVRPAAGRHSGPSAQPAAVRCRAAAGSSRATASCSRGSPRSCRRTATARSSSASSPGRPASTRTRPRCPTSTRTCSARARTPARGSTTSTPSGGARRQGAGERAAQPRPVRGIFARAGLVTDVELFEEFPAHYEVAAARQHRWARGDWQLLPWIFGRRPDGHPGDRPLEDARQPAPDAAGAGRCPHSGRRLDAARRLARALDRLRAGDHRPAGAACAFLAGLIPRRRGISKRSHLRGRRPRPRPRRRPDRADGHLPRPPGLGDGRRDRAHAGPAPVDAPADARVGDRGAGEDRARPRAAGLLPPDGRRGGARGPDGGFTIGAVGAVGALGAVGAAGAAPGSWHTWLWAAPLLLLWGLAPGAGALDQPAAGGRGGGAPQRRRSAGPAAPRPPHLALLRDLRRPGGPRPAARQLPGGLPGRWSPTAPRRPTSASTCCRWSPPATSAGSAPRDCVERLEATLATHRAGSSASAATSTTGTTPATCAPLEPRYVSTVDSGNLAGHLLALAAGLPRRSRRGRSPAGSALAGLADAARACCASRRAGERRPARPRRSRRRQLDEALGGGRRRRGGRAGGSRGGRAVGRLTLGELGRELHAAGGRGPGARRRAGGGRRRRSLAGGARPGPSAARGLRRRAMRGTSRRRRARRPSWRRASRRWRRDQRRPRAHAMDFGFLYDPTRKLFSIGYRVAEGELDAELLRPAGLRGAPGELRRHRQGRRAGGALVPARPRR